MFSELAPGVFSVESRFVDGKNGIICGVEGALAVDGSNYEDEGQAMADFIRNLGEEPNRLALTHGHGDHILGANPLGEGDVFAHELTPEVIRSQVPGWAKKWDMSEAEAESRIVHPTVTFRNDLWIDLGDKHVWMFATPGHSDDGVSIYVEEDRLLFSGDSVVTGIVAAIGNSEVLESSLYKILEVDIETLVPGHGDVISGVDRVKDWLKWQIGYLSSVRHRIWEELDRGTDPEAVAGKVDFETYIGDRLPSDRNGMPDRHRTAVTRILEEELFKWRNPNGE